MRTDETYVIYLQAICHDHSDPEDDKMLIITNQSQMFTAECPDNILLASQQFDGKRHRRIS